MLYSFQAESSQHLNYQFPVGNFLTNVDEKYFNLIESETNWEDIKGNNDHAGESLKINSNGAPDSNALTETDRKYFNVVKTEDGISKFLTSNPNQVRIPQFQFHQVQQENKKPIVGLYLQDPLL